MSKFNLKQSKKDYFVINEKMLEENNEEHGLSEISDPGNINYNLGEKSRKNKDNTVPFNRQLTEASERDTTVPPNIEGKLNDDPKLFNDKRRDKESTMDLTAINALSEGYHQEKLSRYKEQEDNDKRNTEFWDKFVGMQLTVPMTYVDDNVKDGQLENDPNRFDDLNKTQPITGDFEENQKIDEKPSKIRKMVSASLKDADAMLFHIYAKAHEEKRDINAQEKAMVEKINSEKEKILSNKK